VAFSKFNGTIYGCLQLLQVTTTAFITCQIWPSDLQPAHMSHYLSICKVFQLLLHVLGAVSVSEVSEWVTDWPTFVRVINRLHQTRIVLQFSPAVHTESLSDNHEHVCAAIQRLFHVTKYRLNADKVWPGVQAAHIRLTTILTSAQVTQLHCFLCHKQCSYNDTHCFFETRATS